MVALTVAGAPEWLSVLIAVLVILAILYLVRRF